VVGYSKNCSERGGHWRRRREEKRGKRRRRIYSKHKQ
jgi:hypothetical protein